METQTANPASRLRAVPQLPYEVLYFGIDMGKYTHYAGFVPRTLLLRHERFEGCPTLAFAQSRDGFRALVLALTRMIHLRSRTGEAVF
jgi:hypothetical protein